MEEFRILEKAATWYGLGCSIVV